LSSWLFVRVVVQDQAHYDRLVLSALVLTAGLGTRLDPLTRLVAKPAVPVAGHTLIERVLDWLRRQDVREAVLNLHHRPDTLARVVGDGTHLGLRVRYSWERSILGSAGGPRHALPLLPETFVIANGDTLCEVDLRAMIAAHEARAAAVTLAVVPNAAPDRYNGIVADDQHRVLGFAPKGRADGTWHFVGIQVVSAALFRPLVDDEAVDTVAGIYRDRVASGERDIHIHPVSAPFIDVGTPRDYLETCLAVGGGEGGRERAARRPEDGSIIETPAAHVPESATVRRSIVWAGSEIGAGVHLDECIVAGARVPAAFTARRATLVPASVVRPDESVETIGDMAVFPFVS
jgi:mannose-1-phosphate guanylyltransferase